MRRRDVLAATAGACIASPALAQEPWPGNRPIRLIVVYPPGGLSDGVARALADILAKALPATIVPDHRPGGGGSVGMEMLARAPADGHTLAFSAISPLTLRPHLEKVTYDPFKDIAPVAAVMFTPVLLVGTPAFTGNSFADLLVQARAQPGALRWATSGIATAGHLVLEQVSLGAGVSVTHIPYKGGGQQLTDALGGQFELLSTNVAPEQLRQVASGRFKALAVGAPSRLSVLPGVPTFRELGLADANIASLFGVFAPGGTPEPVLARLNAEIGRALELPEFRRRLVASDNLPAGGTRADFAAQIALQWRANSRLKMPRPPN